MFVPLIVRAAEETPEPNDVVAGWTGFTVFVLLIVAVAVLGWSLTKQLKKVDRAEAAGLYGHDDRPVDEADDSGEPADAQDPHDATTEKRD